MATLAIVLERRLISFVLKSVTLMNASNACFFFHNI
ncbi:TPA: cyclic lactone autoinducer peptide [Salmonella enterica subsp. enterica serovar Decatur]|uniref:Cyclic lactone autoinducer peptide n=1 Tax=Salmonella typhisuis TaxID=41529 RepID=A0A735ISL2_SALTP|nr:cyclic lactone autoinducer peptide [Salmonella enterica subsp. enterica serovar Typhisuis str. CFSAN000655]EDV3174309.1 cyclic lactone autoinducer peptide [Salmonella enterica subsp. enterica serovar Bonn]EEJ7184459.1 cyclic lactone autoinducer peptide [Salmonella enterica subsp. enterica]HAE6955670.1 cyclic lactone autoinducer peptide [Salmonella enterica subsp. enterica serovar Typhisuis]HAG3353285.1 cyclic lactone autoinducer peptide [Salmonella enterica]HBL7092796.1 cyclic lactone autoi